MNRTIKHASSTQQQETRKIVIGTFQTKGIINNYLCIHQSETSNSTRSTQSSRTTTPWCFRSAVLGVVVVLWPSLVIPKRIRLSGTSSFALSLKARRAEAAICFNTNFTGFGVLRFFDDLPGICCFGWRALPLASPHVCFEIA